MAHTNKPIVIPWDFTEVSDYALVQSIAFANLSESGIILLHIARNDNQIQEAIKKLQTIADDIFIRFKIQPTVMVRKGTIFDTIGQVAKDLDAQLVVMGTHGIKGFQKWLGSWALKVVIATKAPVVIVQKMPEKAHFETLVVPFEQNEEELEKLRWIHQISNYNPCKVVICYSKKTIIRQEEMMQLNLKIASKYLKYKQIPFEFIQMEGKKSFADETIDFATPQKAGLLLIMVSKNLSLTDFAFGQEEQRIITNKSNVPVMCVNPRDL